jgi:alkylhydroperoxidase family enzyme
MAGLSPDQIRQARTATSNDPLDDAIMAFAIKLIQQRGMVSDEDLKAAREAGVDDGLMMEIIANIALMTVTNYANRLADPEIDFPVVQIQL